VVGWTLWYGSKGLIYMEQSMYTVYSVDLDYIVQHCSFLPRTSPKYIPQLPGNSAITDFAEFTGSFVAL
jgi:hypothetical protein